VDKIFILQCFQGDKVGTVIVALITAPKRPNNFLGCWANQHRSLSGAYWHEASPTNQA
jgi:hypothetical protein